MKMNFSILDIYGGETQRLEATAISIKDGLVEIWDCDATEAKPFVAPYVKSILRLAEGTRITHSEEIDG